MWLPGGGRKHSGSSSGVLEVANRFGVPGLGFRVWGVRPQATLALYSCMKVSCERLVWLGLASHPIQSSPLNLHCDYDCVCDIDFECFQLLIIRAYIHIYFHIYICIYLYIYIYMYMYACMHAWMEVGR